MLKALISVRMRALLSVLTGSARKKQAQSKGALIGFAALMLFSLGSLGFLFWHIFDTLALPFHMLGMDWLYYAMAALMGLALMLVGTVFTAKSQLFEAKDNDLLLSLPIRPGDILLSRMFLLWVVSLLFQLAVAVPVLIARPAALSGPGAAAYVLLFFGLLPLLVLAVSTLLAWLLHRITARFGHKPFVTVLLWMVFLFGYMFLSFRMNNLLNDLAADPAGLAAGVGAAAPLVWIGRAVAEGDMAALLKLAALILVAFALAYLLLSRSFIRTATDQRGTAKKRYVEQRAKPLSPARALLRRELRRLWACPAYLFNSGLGVVLAVMGAVVLLWKRNDLAGLMVYPGLDTLLRLVFLMAACFLATSIFLTAPSISLEGKTLWISQSLPVDTRAILRAKLRLHLWVSLPAILLFSLCAALVLGTGGLLLLCQLLLPLVYGVFMGLFGLVENLRHPNLDWINETQAVKSGSSVVITMFGGWGTVLLPTLVYILWGEHLSGEAIALATAALLLAASLLLYRWLMTRGAEIFRSL